MSKIEKPMLKVESVGILSNKNAVKFQICKLLDFDYLK
jgi:hypothetical protein